MTEKHQNNNTYALSESVIIRIYRQISLFSSVLFIGISLFKLYVHANFLILLTYFIISSSFILMTYFFSGKHAENKVRGKYLLIILYITVVVWDFITNGGLYSPALFLVFPVIVIVVFLFNKKNRIIITSTLFIIYTLLMGIQYFWPNLIPEKSALSPPVNLERTLAFMVSLLFTSLIIAEVLKQNNASKENASKSIIEKEKFLEIMSHMIRTPLNIINGFSNLLLEEGITKTEKNGLIKKMVKNAESLNRLVTNLSDLAIIQDKSLKLYPTKFTLIMLFDEIKKLGVELTKANHHHVDFVTYLPSKIQSEELQTDYQRLMQAMVHIIENAIKFTKEGSVKLTVSMDKDKFITFGISDTGIGMSLAEQEQLFHLINKQNTGFNQTEEGAGIGLNIAHGIINEMKGRIHIQSRLHMGTQVLITIPKDLTL